MFNNSNNKTKTPPPTSLGTPQEENLGTEVKEIPFTIDERKGLEIPLIRGGRESDGVFSTKAKFIKYAQLPYNPKLKEKAKALRKSGNLSEVIFWNAVKNKKLLGLDFERQKIIGNYIVDFYCPELGVVIEIDGESHDFKGEYDQIRENYLKNLSLDMIHYSDLEIKKALDVIMGNLYIYLKSKQTQNLGNKLSLDPEETPRQASPATPLRTGNFSAIDPNGKTHESNNRLENSPLEEYPALSGEGILESHENASFIDLVDSPEETPRQPVAATPLRTGNFSAIDPNGKTHESNNRLENSPLEEYPALAGGGVLESVTDTDVVDVIGSPEETPRQASPATPHEGNFDSNLTHTSK